MVGQQPVRPIDRCGETAVPRIAAEARTGQHVHSSTQMGEDLGRSHRPSPCGGELDRQRHAIEMTAQGDDGRQLLVGDRRSGVARTLEKQAHRVAVGVGSVGVRHSERAENDEGLVREVEGGAARGEHGWRLAGIEKVGDGVGCGGSDVLAVVDDQEHRPVRR